MTIDVCTYNGEKELWDIHYNTLKHHVDEFIVIEFDKSFSGRAKEPSFDINKYPDVSYYFNTETIYGKYREMAEESPNTQGADHWKREFMQKESIKDTLTHLNDDDLVFIGDVDEVWDVSATKLMFPVKLKLAVYTYYLNNRSTEQFWGTTVASYGVIKATCLNHLRTNAPRSKKIHGWHFTSMAKDLRKKLTDSYTQESYATPYVLENLRYNIENGKDFLGRDFTYRVDESQWPEYLKDNRGKYKELCMD
tara:strand:+ start:728 stop:1480 length:753 start_codon:yes stop_codon:yes gene_type:complete